MNVPQTLVAALTIAGHYDEVTEEMVLELEKLLEGSTHMERMLLLAYVVNIQSYSLELLEQHTPLSRAGFLRELGLDIAAKESEEKGDTGLPPPE